MSQINVTSLSSKGQVVIPNNIRALLGINTGAKLLVFTDGDNLLLKPIKAPKLEIFKTLIKESGKITRSRGIKKRDLPRLIRKARYEGRS